LLQRFHEPLFWLSPPILVFGTIFRRAAPTQSRQITADTRKQEYAKPKDWSNTKSGHIRSQDIYEDKTGSLRPNSQSASQMGCCLAWHIGQAPSLRLRPSDSEPPADREVDFRTDATALDWETSGVDFRNADSQGGFFVCHTTRYVIGL
jgi:hypothetical protein